MGDEAGDPYESPELEEPDAELPLEEKLDPEFDDPEQTGAEPLDGPVQTGTEELIGDEAGEPQESPELEEELSLDMGLPAGLPYEFPELLTPELKGEEFEELENDDGEL